MFTSNTKIYIYICILSVKTTDKAVSIKCIIEKMSTATVSDIITV